MALTVNTNLAAMRASNALNKTQSGLSHTLAKISGGLRVTKAADDAAGSAVASNLQTVARSGRQAICNANDGISIIQTAEGATKEVLNILDRMREPLSRVRQKHSMTASDRTYIDEEFEQLSDEVERIAQATEFNDLQLADGSKTTLSVQVGVTSGTESQLEITLGNLTVSKSCRGYHVHRFDQCNLGCRTAIDTIDNGNRHRKQRSRWVRCRSKPNRLFHCEHDDVRGEPKRC